MLSGNWDIIQSRTFNAGSKFTVHVCLCLELYTIHNTRWWISASVRRSSQLEENWESFFSRSFRNDSNIAIVGWIHCANGIEEEKAASGVNLIRAAGMKMIYSDYPIDKFLKIVHIKLYLFHWSLCNNRNFTSIPRKMCVHSGNFIFKLTCLITYEVYCRLTSSPIWLFIASG